MTFLFGTSIAACLCFLTITMGYALVGFLPAESRLTRLALASLAGLGWLLFGASVLGAVSPLKQTTVWLLWTPVLLTSLIPTARKQFKSDLQALVRSSRVYAGLAGLALLWLALLLPYLIYPDLAFFDGKTNHDNFFWCIGAEYLQSHSYLTAPTQSQDLPLYNIVNAFIGWKPVWGRMGAEGFIAATSSTVGQPAIRLYNFLVSSLVVPWLLTVLAIARLVGLPPLNRWLLVLVCFSQPLLFFFVANGNLPNFLGTIFSGGLWLLMLLVYESRLRSWPLLGMGMLFVHGILCSYPEIMAFALIPVGVLAGWRLIQATPGRAKPLLFLIGLFIGGLCLNPLTTARTWSGMMNSISQVHEDIKWANVFSRLTYAGYVPSLVTLAMPSVRVVGFLGGALASIAILISSVLVIRNSPRRSLLLIPLAGFATLLIYTIVTSFSYGWQKSAQFFGIHLAVLFPVLLAGLLQDSFSAALNRRLIPLLLGSTLAVVVLGTLGNAVENLKSSSTKGLTHSLLRLSSAMTPELLNQPIYIDGATFSAGFFHSMWATRLFPHNPVRFLSRHQDQAGGYLNNSVKVENAAASSTSIGAYYVATEWARAFDYQPLPLATDRVGVLLKQHNLITEMIGFYRPTGVPAKANGEFSLTVYPYADGWLEFVLTPNGQPASDCHLQGHVTTDTGASEINVPLSAQQQLVARFPLKAGTRNVVTAKISGAPKLDPNVDDPPYAFLIEKVTSARLP